MSTETSANRFPGSLQIDIPHNTANDWNDLSQPDAVMILSKVYKSVILSLLPYPAGVCERKRALRPCNRELHKIAKFKSQNLQVNKR